MTRYIGALDLGTTSNRFIIFDREARIVGLDQLEHEQIFPRPGWVEHDPMEIWKNTGEVIRGALKELTKPIDGDGDAHLTVQVIGPPRYRVTMEAENYKTAENLLQQRVSAAEAYLNDHDGTFEFSRSAK